MTCPECGFDFDAIAPDELGPQLRSITARFRDRLAGADAASLDRRPAPDIWSAREYGSHVQDVLLNLRDRVLLALLEDVPTFAPIHRDERVESARYRLEPPSLIATAIVTAGELLAFLLEQLRGEELARRGVYAGVERDVLWIGRQALHEALHHFGDVERCLTP